MLLLRMFRPIVGPLLGAHLLCMLPVMRASLGGQLLAVPVPPASILGTTGLGISGALRPAPGIVTWPTMPIAFYQEDVLRGAGMAPLAMACSCSGRGSLLAMCDSVWAYQRKSQMRWTHTGTIATQVMQFVTGGDGAIHQFIRESVCREHSAITAKNSVTITSARAPLKTFAIRAHFGPESLGVGHSHEVKYNG